jgi:proteasome beta subunit
LSRGLPATTAPRTPARHRSLPRAGAATELCPHGTTIVALTFEGGVVMAGDRRATMGNLIASATSRRSSRPTSTRWSASPAPPAWRWRWSGCFQVELEHYEKIEGTPLSMEGKANRLAAR